MTQDVPAAVDTEIAAEQSRPVILLEMTITAGTLRYAASKSNMVFPTGGNTYTGRSFSVSNIKRTAEGAIAKGTITFDNVTGEMTSYLNAESFNGKGLIIKKVYRDALGNAANYRELFNGYMEEVTRMTLQSVEIPFTDGRPINRRLLLDIYQKACNNKFGDAKCNKDSLADLTSLTASGTADSGSITTLTDNALTQSDDHWNHGRIEITYNSIVYVREVKDFDAATDTITFDAALPFSIDSTCTYTVYKGCDQTWDTCQASNAWGPSGDNKANFRGMIHIESGVRMGWR